MYYPMVLSELSRQIGNILLQAFYFLVKVSLNLLRTRSSLEPGLYFGNAIRELEKISGDSFCGFLRLLQFLKRGYLLLVGFCRTINISTHGNKLVQFRSLLLECCLLSFKNVVD